MPLPNTDSRSWADVFLASAIGALALVALSAGSYATQQPGGTLIDMGIVHLNGSELLTSSVLAIMGVLVRWVRRVVRQIETLVDPAGAQSVQRLIAVVQEMEMRLSAHEMRGEQMAELIRNALAALPHR